MTHGLRVAATPRNRRTEYQEQQKPRPHVAEASALAAICHSGMSIVWQLNIDGVPLAPLDFFRVER